MLTPIDIQYVVGLLSLGATPEKVEVELGSMVYDVASKTARDVDVTMRVEDEKKRMTAYKGIEVKDHKRPLGSEHVEQLAAKLNDMPALSHRAIVSASGYTRPGVRKADAKGIQLFELRDWTDRATTFEHFGTELLPSDGRTLNWLDSIHITFSASDPRRGLQIPIQLGTPIKFGGITTPDCPDIGTLGKNLQVKAINHMLQMEKVTALPNNAPIHARVVVQISDQPSIVSQDGEVVLNSATIEGKVEWTQLKLDTVFKI